MVGDGTELETRTRCGAGRLVFWDCGNDVVMVIVCVVVTFCCPGAAAAVFAVNLWLDYLSQDLTVHVGQVKMLPMSWKMSFLRHFLHRVHDSCAFSEPFSFQERNSEMPTMEMKKQRKNGVSLVALVVHGYGCPSYQVLADSSSVATPPSVSLPVNVPWVMGNDVSLAILILFS